MNKLSLLLLLMLGAAGLHAQQSVAKRAPAPAVPSTVVTAGGFAGYYYNMQNPNASLTDRNAFELRRVNLGAEHKFSRYVTAVAEIEANEAGAGGTYGLSLRQANVEIRNILPQMRVVMGLSPTPAVVTSERIWGYRSLQTMPLEYYGMAPAVDNGIAVKGKIDPHGIVAYHVMVGNGSGTMRETNSTQKIYASLGLTPVAGFTLEGYADFESETSDRYRASFKGLVGLEETGYAVALEGIYRINHHTLTPFYDQSPFAVSLYGWVEADTDIRLVFRGDYYDDDQNKPGSGLRSFEATIGVDYIPVKGVHVIPNIGYGTYTNKNSAVPKSDDAITLRLTAAFSFTSLK